MLEVLVEIIGFNFILHPNPPHHLPLVKYILPFFIRPNLPLVEQVQTVSYAVLVLKTTPATANIRIKFLVLALVKVVLAHRPVNWRVDLVVIAFHSIFYGGSEDHINKDEAVCCNQIDHLVRLGIHAVLALGYLVQMHN